MCQVIVCQIEQQKEKYLLSQYLQYCGIWVTCVGKEYEFANIECGKWVG